ncbi:MAG: hypothetical protein AAF456_19755 [Planctomycetota bacterium]
MSNDPFRSEVNNQLMREARIGLTALAVMLGLFAYVAWFKIARPTRLPENVASAPIAQQVWPGQNAPESEPRTLSESFADLLDSTRRTFTSNNRSSDSRPEPRQSSPELAGNSESRAINPSDRSIYRDEGSELPSRVVTNASGSLPNPAEPLHGLLPVEPQPSSEVPAISASVPTTAQFATGLQSSPPEPRPLSTVPDDNVQLAQFQSDVPTDGLRPLVPAPNGLTTSGAESPLREPVLTQTPPDCGTFQPVSPQPPGTNVRSLVQPASAPPFQSGTVEETVHPLRSPASTVETDAGQTEYSGEPAPSIGINELRGPQSGRPVPAVDVATIPDVQRGHEGRLNPIRTAQQPVFENTFVRRESPQPLESATSGTVSEPARLQSAPELELSGGRTIYIIVEDDSFYSVAQSHYGDGRMFRALYAHNRQNVDSFEQPSPGLEISIPELSELVRLWPEHCPEDVLRNSRPASAASSRMYVTRDGDTLFEIARDHLGQASRYFEIMEINDVRLPREVHHLSSLPAGIRLVLPVEVQ